jgi:hypothetical protein
MLKPYDLLQLCPTIWKTYNIVSGFDYDTIVATPTLGNPLWPINLVAHSQYHNI